MNRIVLASNNKKKVAELNDMLLGLNFKVMPQSDFLVESVPETGSTFVENAIIKARHAARITGLPSLADDSGLEVDALHGAPGVYSARYAGEPKSDARNNEKLLADLAGQADRRAHFVSLIVFVRHADDPQPIIAEGEWHGAIIDDYRGQGGFGYDPLFFLPEHGLTSAELDAVEKNRRSHRGQALARLVEQLERRFSARR